MTVESNNDHVRVLHRIHTLLCCRIPWLSRHGTRLMFLLLQVRAAASRAARVAMPTSSFCLLPPIAWPASVASASGRGDVGS
ncbi:hypothetical protein BU14_0103s0050 [Porphyra umbilicalis]|uniref:Uncharacterized protein n=1 Tax=Porphyra umbilicalis TaxID=2786 RepID=A0A1X6PCW0_PORUM|nr:hypothetical protein BU14_0103s0050 [Porphyra umbilicalis]|eukprot:OSX78707.1 hypothetical protein BU14_0103s0050 [Porphyra umbilicalis]